MTIEPRRGGMLFAVLLASLGIAAAPASASNPTHTTVTTPGNGAYLVYDNQASGPSNQFDVAGTSDGTSGYVDIICTDTEAGGYFYSQTVEFSVPVQSDGSFDDSSVPTDVGVRPCELRAVPSGTDPYNTDLSPFTGPTVYPELATTDSFGGGPNAGKAFEYFIWQGQPAGYATFQALGGCSLDTGLVAGTTLGDDMFDCDAGLSDHYSSVRGSTLVDGRPAWSPAGAWGEHILPPSGSWGASSNGQSLPGFPNLDVTHTLDPTTHTLTIDESDPLMECGPDASSYPPTTTSCTQWVSAGVTDHRTIVQDHQGDQISFHDVFESTDGKAHSVDLLFASELSSDLEQPVFRFPWVSGNYAPQDANTIVPASPYAVSTVYVKDDAYTPDGSTLLPHGAITFGEPLSALIFTGNPYSSDMFEHVQRTVPAGGSVQFDAVYSQGTTEAAVDALAAEAESRFPQSRIPVSTTTGQQPLPSASAKSRAPRLRPRGLTLHVGPRRRHHVPAEFTIGGRVELPAHSSAATACRAGIVTVQVKAGRDTISLRRARLRRDCTYRVRVTFHVAWRLRGGHLRMFARFSGNGALGAVRARSVSARVG